MITVVLLLVLQATTRPGSLTVFVLTVTHTLYLLGQSSTYITDQSTFVGYFNTLRRFIQNQIYKHVTN